MLGFVAQRVLDSRSRFTDIYFFIFYVALKFRFTTVIIIAFKKKKKQTYGTKIILNSKSRSILLKTLLLTFIFPKVITYLFAKAISKYNGNYNR